MATPTAADLGGLDAETRARIERTFGALRPRGIEAVFVPDRAAALASVLGMLPEGALVAHGTSATLNEIGLVDALKSAGPRLRYGNPEWAAEPDMARRLRLRAKITAESDVFLGSVQTICETGEVVAADASGSRQAGYIFGPPKVIWVAGINKLVPTLEDGLRRLHEVALPQEDARVKRAGQPGSFVGKLVIYERERPGRIRLILVGEPLGF